ncbi:DUF4232 domain-containing protein [Prescottella agglutinans]|uniref:DUF4232 domain-containing protein n=1 Tax=Prescottella agglutinans TaxID=1644129 RepID=A0ABT6MBF7_9NOCA|nr:DUF4232 domain-containing protein [Prescottella agglutinans]MDH6281633.1 hypothetical protein [Prescottella agglutinans]
MQRQSLVFRGLGLLGAAAVLAAAGCSTNEDGTPEPSPAASPAPSATTTAAPAAATSTTTTTAPTSTFAPAAHPDGCAVNELRLTLGQTQGAAGSTELPLVFTNVGGRTCVLDGFPGVSYVQGGADGAQIGSAATRSGESNGAVPLAPNGTATAMVRAVHVENYPAETCVPTDVTGLRVYPPNDTGSMFVPYATKGCSGTGDNLDQLSVQAVTA